MSGAETVQRLGEEKTTKTSQKRKQKGLSDDAPLRPATLVKLSVCIEHIMLKRNKMSRFRRLLFLSGETQRIKRRDMVEEDKRPDQQKDENRSRVSCLPGEGHFDCGAKGLVRRQRGGRGSVGSRLSSFLKPQAATDVTRVGLKKKKKKMLP